jgi:hypothetical protein
MAGRAAAPADAEIGDAEGLLIDPGHDRPIAEQSRLNVMSITQGQIKSP